MSYGNNEYIHESGGKHLTAATGLEVNRRVDRLTVPA